MDKVQDKDVRPAVRLRQPDRAQVEMVIQSPDDLIPADHQARVIWRVCQAQDWSAFCAPLKARQGVCGRDATSPVLLASLWLYAAVRGVGSARELARLCTESKPYRWLCGGVSVNHHTLSDFRVAHGAALDELFTRMIAMLVAKRLVTVHRISQDGTRVRAFAGASSFRREKRLQHRLAQAAQHVQDLKQLLADPERSAGLSARQKAARTRAAREREQRIEQAIKRLPQLKEKQDKLAKQKSKKERSG